MQELLCFTPRAGLESAVARLCPPDTDLSALETLTDEPTPILNLRHVADTVSEAARRTGDRILFAMLPWRQWPRLLFVCFMIRWFTSSIKELTVAGNRYEVGKPDPVGTLGEVASIRRVRGRYTVTFTNGTTRPLRNAEININTIEFMPVTAG